MRSKNWILVALIGSSISAAIIRCSRELNADERAELARRARGPLVLDRASVLQISVALDGGILADGRATTLDAVAKRLDELKRNGGRVWVYREPAETPPAPTMQILELATARRLDVAMSGERDFSDLIEEDHVVWGTP